MQAKAIMAPAGGGALRLRGTTGARPDKSRLWTTRLQKELERLWFDPPEWCVPGADATDLFHWQVIVAGPRGSPYDGGVFAVRFKFPRHYPLKPPKVTFATKVYHPNIHPRTGLVGLDFLTDSKHWWTPAWTVDKILLVIVSLLHEPVMDGRTINPDAANLYRRKRLRYVEIAKAKTLEHATAAASSSSSAAASEKERRPQSRRGVSLCRQFLTRVTFLQTSG